MKKNGLDLREWLNPPQQAIFLPVSPSALKLAKNPKTLIWLILLLVVAGVLLVAYFSRSA